MTAVVFFSYSFVAIHTKGTYTLFMSGTALSFFIAMAAIMISSNFISIEVRHYFIVLLPMTFALIWIIYDTHWIIRKFYAGDTDFVGHSLHLFNDLMLLFKIICRFLKDEKKNRRQQEKKWYS